MQIFANVLTLAKIFHAFFSVLFSVPAELRMFILGLAWMITVYPAAHILCINHAQLILSDNRGRPLEEHLKKAKSLMPFGHMQISLLGERGLTFGGGEIMILFPDGKES